MTRLAPAEIRERLARLRDAGEKLRRRPPNEVIDALGRVFDGWCDPASRWRQKLERELPAATGFSPETLREGLALGLANWNAAALRGLAARELEPGEGARAEGFPTTAVLLAGSIPMPSLLALLAPLAVHSPVLAKSASRDPVTPGLVARSVADTDPGLGRCIEVIDFPGADSACRAALLEADCICATGSDATIAEVRAAVRGGRRVVADGHRLSVAAIGAGADIASVARLLALDVGLWDQLGCLSPLVVHAEGDDLADSLAEALAAELEALELRMPRGEVPVGAIALTEHERAEAELRAGAGGGVRLHAGGAWTVVRETDATPRPAPLHRFVRVVPVSGHSALLEALAPLSRHLAGVALAGFGSAGDSLAVDLGRLGASRICPPGRLQAPPLGWHHDGRGVLSPLARFTDLEGSM